MPHMSGYAAVMISTPAGLHAMLDEAGNHPIASPEDWWLIAMGSGYRGTLAQMEPLTFERIREKNLARLTQCDAIAVNVVDSVAAK
jgi:hypothetical protein